MADIRCPNCGKNNPDWLDVCQFCQTPLKPDSILRIGEKPTKKNTGELEPILPDWLRDVRQQARTAAEEEAAEAASHRPDSKDEPPDLLAGLASQAGSGEEEAVPDWLARLSPAAKPAAPSASEPTGDFFAELGQKESPAQPVDEPHEEQSPAWMGSPGEESQSSSERDELSEWFAQASGQTEQPPAPQGQVGEMGWGTDVESPAAPAEPEDLSWLRNLEAAARQTGDLQAQRSERDWQSDFDASAPSQPSAAGDDLSWLDQLGGIEERAPVDAAPKPSTPEQAFTSGQDLDWLNQLGGPSEPVQAEPDSSGPEDSRASEDLSWLNDLGKPGPASEPSPAQEDLSWLDSLGGQSEPRSVPPFAGMEMESEAEKVSPRHTAPLSHEKPEEAEPDWLRQATEAPSMPAPGDLSLDWFSSQPPAEETAPPAGSAAAFEGDIFSTPDESPALSNQDVDSLFSVDMPDWLSRPEAGTGESISKQAGPAPVEGEESLAPVDLPSWVQAMRPVEAVISETASSAADQPAETEGPLAGLHGVIPIAPTGSARRPRPVSLTLQASAEQQASALLLEQILGAETSPRTLVTSTLVTSQQWLRWTLAAFFLLVLSGLILLRSEMMPVTAALPPEASGLRSALMGLPASARMLVVVDYEPALAGEMEAISAPLLDQIAVLNQPQLSFLSTSPNGAALVERLVTRSGLSETSARYVNLGYLPGGSVGVLGFLEAPGQIIPTAGVGSFSDYAGVLVLTDRAESGRVWIEQLQNRKQADLALQNQPLLMVASAQAVPLLEPYVASGQITGLIGGISGAARYEALNNGRPGIARSYWDTFGAGLMLSVAVIVIGSLWSLLAGMRAHRANAEQG